MERFLSALISSIMLKASSSAGNKMFQGEKRGKQNLLKHLCSTGGVHIENCERTVDVWLSQLSATVEHMWLKALSLIFQWLLAFHPLFSPHNIKMSIFSWGKVLYWFEKKETKKHSAWVFQLTPNKVTYWVVAWLFKYYQHCGYRKLWELVVVL